MALNLISLCLGSGGICRFLVLCCCVRQIHQAMSSIVEDTARKFYDKDPMDTILRLRPVRDSFAGPIGENLRADTLTVCDTLAYHSPDEAKKLLMGYALDEDHTTYYLNLFDMVVKVRNAGLKQCEEDALEKDAKNTLDDGWDFVCTMDERNAMVSAYAKLIEDGRRPTTISQEDMLGLLTEQFPDTPRVLLSHIIDEFLKQLEDSPVQQTGPSFFGKFRNFLIGK